MQALRFTAIGSLLVLGLVFGLQQAPAEDKSEEGALRVILKSVEVMTTKSGGDAWDVNDGKPDLVINVKNLSDTTQKEVYTEEKTDVFSATYDAATVLAKAGHKVRIQVLDKDVAANDTIGETTLEVTEDMLKKGKASLSFGQVKSLMLEFRK
jgi:hypothetical protein